MLMLTNAMALCIKHEPNTCRFAFRALSVSLTYIAIFDVFLCRHDVGLVLMVDQTFVRAVWRLSEPRQRQHHLWQMLLQVA